MGGKRKGKVKFRNADEARKARELDASWKELQDKWGVEAEEKKRKRAMSAPALDYKLEIPQGRSTKHIPSRVTEGGSTAPIHKVYTKVMLFRFSAIRKHKISHGCAGNNKELKASKWLKKKVLKWTVR